jgi:hypothetical protein
MEIDLKKFIWAPCPVRCTDNELPPPPHWDYYTRALLVSKDRRHLWFQASGQEEVNWRTAGRRRTRRTGTGTRTRERRRRRRTLVSSMQRRRLKILQGEQISVKILFKVLSNDMDPA